MIHCGENIVNGVAVVVERKPTRRINIRVTRDGQVRLSVPKWRATLGDGEAFLLEKWPWIAKTRAEMLARPAPSRLPVADEDRRRVMDLLGRMTAQWAERLGEGGVSCRFRLMKTLWGSCHWRRRLVTYNTELAHVPEDLAEYVVVHELTHLRAHDHGPSFCALMDARLPGWKTLRRRLNKREFAAPAPVLAPEPPRIEGRVCQMTLDL